jgi:hypothetical protein
VSARADQRLIEYRLLIEHGLCAVTSEMTRGTGGGDLRARFFAGSSRSHLQKK